MFPLFVGDSNCPNTQPEMKWELELKIISQTVLRQYHLISLMYMQPAPLQHEYASINFDETINTFSFHMKRDRQNKLDPD